MPEFPSTTSIISLFPPSDELARDSDVTVSTTVTPQAEYKGFSAYVISCIFITIWLCWSLLPDSILNTIGIYYYPSRWWALAIPAYVLVTMVYMYVSIANYNIEILTLPLDDNRNIVDDTGVVLSKCESYQYIHKSSSGAWDLPLSVCNEILYGEA